MVPLDQESKIYLDLEGAKQKQIKPGKVFISLSYAQSLDGCLSELSGQPSQISGEESRRMTHRLRSMHDGILVGVETVIADDPQLNVRFCDGTDPTPIVVDTHLRIPNDSCLLNEPEKLILVCGNNAPESRKTKFRRIGVRIFETSLKNQQVCLATAIKSLAAINIRSIMVEGGGRILSSFLDDQLADYLIVTIAPKLMGNTEATRYTVNTGSLRIENSSSIQLGKDIVLWGSPQDLSQADLQAFQDRRFRSPQKTQVESFGHE